MPHNTRTNRRSGKGFPPEYARSLGIDEMPKGGRAGEAGLEAWQLPRPRVMRGVIVSGGVHQRLCPPVWSAREVALARR